MNKIIKLNLVDTTDELYEYTLLEHGFKKHEYDYLTLMLSDEKDGDDEDEYIYFWLFYPECVEDEYDKEYIEECMPYKHTFQIGDTIAFLACDWDDNISICGELTFKKENLFISDEPLNSDGEIREFIIMVNKTDAIMTSGEYLYLTENDLATINKELNKNYKAVIHFS